MLGVCGGCHKKISKKDNFCSDECYLVVNPQFRPRPPAKSYLKPHAWRCAQCGIDFQTTGRKFCSDACRQAAYRERKTTPALPRLLRLRFQVFERDGFKCRYCGRGTSEVALVTDHFVPLKAGGPTELDNLITSCRDCNLGKSDALLSLKP